MSNRLLPKVIFVLGGPGSGKGTQCKKIAHKYGFSHLSAGELLRQEIQNHASQHGKLIANEMLKGRIVPVGITCSLLETAMRNVRHDKFLIDGFPRNKDNIEGLEQKLLDKIKVLFALYFDCPEDVSVFRCLQRGSGQKGAEGGGINGGDCVEGMQERRLDDNEESLRKRFLTHRSDSQVVINYYKRMNLFNRVDASQSEDEVFKEVERIFERYSLKIV